MIGNCRKKNDERGFALLMTVFVIALATILVMDFAAETLSYQRSIRGATDRIQATYILKSTINAAKFILEIPKVDLNNGGQPYQQVHLGEFWARIKDYPLSFLPGEPRLEIIDEAGKIDLNQVLGPAGGGAGGATDSASWKEALAQLLTLTGFRGEKYPPEQFRTLGHTSFNPEQQVAVIHDWGDEDKTSHTDAEFAYEGIESSAEKTWFYNRKFYTIFELAMVPGVTLENVWALAPFVKAGKTTFAQVNANTAPVEVLLALGLEESIARSIEAGRLREPLTRNEIQGLLAGTTNSWLAQILGDTSSQFSVVARLKTASATRWARATIDVAGGGTAPRAIVRSIEYY